MWISKKKLNEMENRIASLERNQKASPWELGTVDLQGLVEKLPKFIKEKGKTVNIEKRIADLEVQVQSQQEVINLRPDGQMHSKQSLKEAFREAFRSLEE